MHLVLPLLWIVPALAQEVPASPAPEAPGVPGDPDPVESAPSDFGEAPPVGLPFTSPQPAPPPVAPLPRARSTRWAAVGPLGEQDFVDVAIHPLRGGIWAVVQADGATWVSVDEGGSWIEVLEGTGVRFGTTSRDEELFMDVQARVDELSGGVDETYDEQAAEDAANEASEAAQDVADGIQGELDQGLWFDSENGSTQSRSGQVRVGFTGAGMLTVARPDGLRVSPDLGASWVQVLDAPISDVEEVGPGELLAVGPEGAFVSSDLVRWTSVVLPMAEPPRDLVVDGGVWATGPSGVWRSDGVTWTELSAGSVDARTVRPVRASGLVPLVVAAPLDVFRAAPYDASPDPVIGGPMPRVLDLERAPDGAILAASANGPYESRDEGRTWEPFAGGLLDPRADAIALRGDEVVLVGAAGVYLLEPLQEAVPLPEQRPTQLSPFVSLNALIDSSLSRRELRQRIGSRIVAAMVPEVVVEYYQVRGEGPKWYNEDPRGTLYDIDSYWRFQTRLTWAPNRQRTGTSFDADTGGDLSIIVVGDDVIVDGEEAPQVLYSKVSRGASKYRSVLSGRVTELYRLRARLLLEEPTKDVRRNVLRELNLAEVDAKLDVLTDGAVSAWHADPTSVPSR